MRHEILVGLRVIDEPGYARYRAAMTPLLEQCGGRFRYDFRVSEVLAGASDRINRVFIISFPDEAARHAFFADERYKKVRTEHFDAAADSAEVIAAFDL
jgi:uncharacterized protein (DUF1330 family)